MANPQVPQGTLNRLRGSGTFAGNPQLNITASFLGKAGITMEFGEITDPIPTMTGIIQSPTPYMMVTVTYHLLKSQNLANVFKTQIERNSNVGDMTVRTDATTLSDYPLVNCAITAGPQGLDLAGTSADFIVKVVGTYYINSDLFGV